MGLIIRKSSATAESSPANRHALVRSPAQLHEQDFREGGAHSHQSYTFGPKPELCGRRPFAKVAHDAQAIADRS